MPLGRPRLLEAGELKEYAARLLAGRALSTAQLKEKLRRRAVSAADVDPIVAELKEYGAVNDRRYAEHYADTRASGGTQGRQRVFADLLRKRVAPRVAEKAVREAFESTDEIALVENWLARKYRNQDLGALLQDPRKLAAVYRRLRLAGFSSGAGIRVLKRFAAEAAGQLEGLEEPGLSET